MKCAAGRFPVVVGTSHGGTAVVVELSQAAEAAGAAAVMVAPPTGLRGDGGDPRALPGGGGGDRDPDRRPGRAGHDRGPHVARPARPHRDRAPGVPLREARGAADADEDHRDAAAAGRRRHSHLRRHERDVLLRGAVARRGRDHDRGGGARRAGARSSRRSSEATGRARRRCSTATRPTSATRASRGSVLRSGRSSCACAVRSRPASCASRARRLDDVTRQELARHPRAPRDPGRIAAQAVAPPGSEDPAPGQAADDTLSRACGELDHRTPGAWTRRSGRPPRSAAAQRELRPASRSKVQRDRRVNLFGRRRVR